MGVTDVGVIIFGVYNKIWRVGFKVEGIRRVGWVGFDILEFFFFCVYILGFRS